MRHHMVRSLAMLRSEPEKIGPSNGFSLHILQLLVSCNFRKMAFLYKFIVNAAMGYI